MAEDHARSPDDHRDLSPDRDRTAEDRDQRAEAHDEVSTARDARADDRDVRAEVREQMADVVDLGARADRRGALRDRQGGASDRAQSADDRHAAAGDRADSARDRTASAIDALTGAHRRDAGVVELQREVDRAMRTERSFTLAFVDVDHLKMTNDSLGHVAGDRLLRLTAESIRARIRSYDLIVRYGGDEFVCALLDVTVALAAERFALVHADLAAHKASVTVGLAQLGADDTLDDLIARADQALYRERQRLRSTDG